MQCPSCGAGNRDGVRNCMSCGASMPVAGQGETRLQHSQDDRSAGAESPAARHSLVALSNPTAAFAEQSVEVSFATAPQAPPSAQLEFSRYVGDGRRYFLLDLLGLGGMGVVFKALDTQLGREVAIKRVLPQYARNRVIAETLVREALATARLNHPNIVKLHDAAIDQDGPYLVFEYIQGTSIDRLIQEAGPIPVEKAARIFKDACAGVAEAHDKGFLHRDIKPGNILLAADGVARVLDFGLATDILFRDGEQAGFVGTWLYSAPEQKLNAAVVDVRADVYSLGATLFHMLSGDAPTHIDLARVPPDWRVIVERATAPDPRMRFQGVHQLRDEVMRVASLAQPEVQGNLACPACHAGNTLQARVCFSCGQTLTIRCPACRQATRIGLPNCDQCGADQRVAGELFSVRDLVDAAVKSGELSRAEELIKHVAEILDAPGVRLGKAEALRNWQTAKCREILLARGKGRGHFDRYHQLFGQGLHDAALLELRQAAHVDATYRTELAARLPAMPVSPQVGPSQHALQAALESDTPEARAVVAVTQAFNSRSVEGSRAARHQQLALDTAALAAKQRRLYGMVGLGFGIFLVLVFGIFVMIDGYHAEQARKREMEKVHEQRKKEVEELFRKTRKH